MKTLFVKQEKVPVCPYCQANNNALSGKHANPRNGDIAICAECCHASVIKVNPIRLCKPKNRKEAKWCDGALEMIKKEI
jgi:hypothetical protein